MKAPFSLIATATVLSAHAATIDWGAENGGFRERDAVKLDGTVEPNGSSLVGNITPANTPTTLSDGLTKIDFTYSGGVGSVDKPDLSGSVFSGTSAGFRTFTNANSAQLWGGVIGGVGQPSILGIQTQGGPISQTDGTLNELGFIVDFSSHGGGGVSSISFTLAGINNKDFSAGGGGATNNDSFRLQAFDASNNPVTLTSSFFTTPTSPTFSTSGLGTSTLSIAGSNGATPVDDHIDTNSNLDVDFGSTVISRIEITYNPEVSGTGTSGSTGFAIGDITFVPEPTSSSLALLGIAGLALRRRRS